MNNPFEQLAVQFVVTVAKRVEGQLVSLVFASPLSARSSDVGLLWHPGYRATHTRRLLVKFVLSLVVEGGKGLLRLAFRMRSWGYAVYGIIGDSILVVPVGCGRLDEDGTFRTSYVETQKNDGLFIFGNKKDCGGNAQNIKKISVIDAWRLTAILAESGVTAFQEIDGPFVERFLLLLYWLGWVISLRWLPEYYLGLSLAAVVQKYKITKIGCVHDMQGYARVVWGVTERSHAIGYTVQHASLSLGKRGYVCYPQELACGLELSDVMYVFNKKIADILKPLYTQTHFFLGCSARYRHWKNIEYATPEGTQCLFIGSLARYDNDTLISCIRRVVSTNPSDMPIRLRLHPFAEISSRDKLWLWIQKRNRRVEISTKTPLRTDIEQALVVVGMSTTVLHEALLLGRPVIQLSHPQYLETVDLDEVRGVLKRDFRMLSIDDIQQASRLIVDPQAMQQALGLHHPVVTYKRLFSPPEGAQL